MPEKTPYNSIKEWRVSNKKAYKDAESQGYINRLCEIFGWSEYVKERGNGHWNLNRCVESAKGLTKKNGEKNLIQHIKQHIEKVGWVNVIKF